MHETTETQKLKTKFVNRDVAIGGNKQILEFIAGVRFQCSPGLLHRYKCRNYTLFV